MRKFFPLLLVLVFFWPVNCFPAPVNFTGFETDAGNVPNNGEDGEFLSTQTTTQSAIKHSGTYSAKTDYSSGQSGGFELNCFNTKGAANTCALNHAYIRFYFYYTTKAAA